MKKLFIFIFTICLSQLINCNVNIQNGSEKQTLKVFVYSQPAEAFQVLKDEKVLKPAESFQIKTDIIKNIEAQIRKNGKWTDINIHPRTNACYNNQNLSKVTNLQPYFGYQKIIIKHDEKNKVANLICS